MGSNSAGRIVFEIPKLKTFQVCLFDLKLHKELVYFDGHNYEITADGFLNILINSGIVATIAKGNWLFIRPKEDLKA